MSSEKTKLTKITGHLGFTVKLSQFEFMRIDFSEEREVNEGVTSEEAYAELESSLQAQMEKSMIESAKIKEARDEQLDLD